MEFPSYPTTRIAVKLKPAAEKMVRQGHPWIFDKGIDKQNKAESAGDLAIIFDRKKNQFLGVGLFDPASPIRIKMLHAGSSIVINQNFFKHRIKQAYQRRQSLLQTKTNSYRLLFGENDGMPGLICDIYAHVLVLKIYSPIWLPYLKGLISHLQEISQCTVGVLRLSRRVAAWKDWPENLKDGQTLFGTLAQETVVFLEHGLKFSAQVVKGHKTGYFLDHRHNRHRIGQLAKDKTVLDVFAYAGGFSVHALMGGARQVLSIDISAQALKMAEANALLNNPEPALETWAIDAFLGMETLQKNKRVFDIVIIDPPSFAKKAEEVDKALLSYQRLLNLAIPLVQAGGILLSCSCSSRITKDQFFQLNQSVLQDSGRFFQLLEQSDHDIDHPISFPEGAYLKSLYYRLG